MAYLLQSLLIIPTLFNCGLSKCTLSEEAEFIQSKLEPKCQNKLSVLKVNSSLSAVNLDSICTLECLGKYNKWLLQECNDEKAAEVVRLSCLKDDTTKVNSRCRFSFPDVTGLEIFHSFQCATLLQNPDGNIVCSTECKEQLNALVDRFGCCFQSVYNNNNSIISLFQEGFLDQVQVGVLKQFEMSSLLKICMDGNVPNSCSGEPFSFAETEISGSTTSLFSITCIIVCAICSSLL